MEEGRIGCDIELGRGSISGRIGLWLMIVAVALVICGAGIAYMHLLFFSGEPQFELPAPTQPTSLQLGG